MLITVLKRINNSWSTSYLTFEGPREQVNAITAWIDASHVYGSSEEEFKHLRDSNRRSKFSKPIVLLLF